MMRRKKGRRGCQQAKQYRKKHITGAWGIVFLFVLAIYIAFSLFVFGGFQHRKRERALYTMGVSWNVLSEELTENAVYLQRFYAPYSCCGIQICLATDEGFKIENNLIMAIHDISGNLLGKHVIDYSTIQNDGYVDVLFDNYVLEEGMQYSFEIATVEAINSPIRLRMGFTESEYCLDVDYQGNPMEGYKVVFNLIYDYTDRNFVIWMFGTVIFLLIMMRILDALKIILYNQNNVS